MRGEGDVVVVVVVMDGRKEDWRKKDVGRYMMIGARCETVGV
jgi:hypothetical protein